ncbi:hypothetical protein ACWEFJ_21470 [Actinosynnema sp. NPDC004786]
MGLLRGGLLALAVSGAVACGAPAVDQGAVPPSTSGAGCAVRYEVADAVAPVGPSSAYAEIHVAPLDPAEQERRRRQRLPLSPRDHGSAVEAAGRVRPALERLCAAGDFGATATAEAFTAAGYPANDVYVQPFPDSAGVGYSLHLGERACVTGHVRPGELLVAVDGARRDGTCAEASG